jgi:hypothetical protein
VFQIAGMGISSIIFIADLVSLFANVIKVREFGSSRFSLYFKTPYEFDKTKPA